MIKDIEGIFNRLQKSYELECKAGDYTPTSWNEDLIQAVKDGLLSYKRGYFLMGCGINLNPSASIIGCFYFTTKKAAIMWKNANYKNALYSVDVCKK